MPEHLSHQPAGQNNRMSRTVSHQDPHRAYIYMHRTYRLRLGRLIIHICPDPQVLGSMQSRAGTEQAVALRSLLALSRDELGSVLTQLHAVDSPDVDGEAMSLSAVAVKSLRNLTSLTVFFCKSCAQAAQMRSSRQASGQKFPRRALTYILAPVWQTLWKVHYSRCSAVSRRLRRTASGSAQRPPTAPRVRSLVCGTAGCTLVVSTCA